MKQQGSTPQSDHQLQSQSNTPDPSGNTDSGNPLVRDDAWFVPLDESPIFIGEAACTAFSSRLRQLLLHTQAEIHIARTHYVQDSQIVQAADENAQWPSRPQAYLLVESVIATVGQCYHISSLSSVRAILEKAYTDRASLSQMKQCKLFALFALAQVYSPRLAESQDSHFPGLPYFAKARALLPVLPERATADHVEILICFVSQTRGRCDAIQLLTEPDNLLFSDEQTTLGILVHRVCNATRYDLGTTPQHCRIPITRPCSKTDESTSMVDSLRSRSLHRK